MTVHASNLIAALRDAIKVQKEREDHMGYEGDSAYVGGLKELLKALQEGETVVYVRPNIM